MSGLLHAPSAEMYESGTFHITNNLLNYHQLPLHGRWGWDYNTFAYGVGITFWSRLEVDYTCVIIDGKRSGVDPGFEFNQDRHFSAKVLLLKEGEIWRWTPSIAVGVSDPATGAGTGDYIGSIDKISSANGYFQRYFIVFTKHLNSSFGSVGLHVGYQYNTRSATKDYLNAPCAGVDWRPIWLQNRWFSPKFIAEYDSKTFNIGFISSIWDDRFEAMFQLIDFRYASFGLRFKLRLKGSE